MSDLTLKTICLEVADASTAEDLHVAITPGLAGQVMQVRTILAGAVSGADDLVILKKNGTAVAGSTITVAYSGSAAGDQDYVNLAYLNLYVKEGDRLTIANGGQSTDAAKLGVSVDIKV